MHLILASSSTGRKKILETLKIPFEVIPSTIDEDAIVGKTPEETIKLRAKAKGEDVSKKNLSSPSSPPYPTYPSSSQTLILSADSGIILDGKLYGKPKNKKEAIQMLQTFSGKTHTFVTALFIKVLSRQPKTRSVLDIRTDLKRSAVEIDKSQVTFRKLTKDDITRYLSLTDYTRYAGGYTLLGTPQDFVVKVSGSLTNVVGLPLEKLIPILENF